MKVSISTLRSIIREELLRNLVESDEANEGNGTAASLVDPRPEELGEVDLDPSNNPGRPADAFDYLGMHPKPEAAMSHPYAAGGGGEAGADPSAPPDDPGGGTPEVA